MRTTSWLVPILVVVATAVAMRSQAQEQRPRLEVCRHTDADGRGSRVTDLRAMERKYKSIAEETGRKFRDFEARVTKARSIRHRSGIGACGANDERVVRLEETVPSEHRKRTLYFVHARRDVARPAILPERLLEGAEIFVLKAESAEELSLLVKAVRRRVTLASAEFAKAVGVRCADARVTFSADGRSATVQEVAP